MQDQLEKYVAKLLRDRAVQPDEAALAAKDVEIVTTGPAVLADLATAVLTRLNCLGLVAARPSLPFADLLVARMDPSETVIIPRDTETRTFLHDIPVLRRQQWQDDPAVIARLLGNRKGVVVEGVGIVASGALTVEQAYINYSSVFHATFVKYLEDLLRDGFRLPGEREMLATFRNSWLKPLTAAGLTFRPGPLSSPDAILAELTAVGRYTVERGLVDSFFGNISWRSGDTVYISQTAASLDELAGCIDPVPFGNSSTAGITASSELAAHRRIYETCAATAILHGHPKFAVVMSMLCAESGCQVTDCWKDCPTVRFLGDTPVVAGEIGAGGLARRVPPVIGGPGKAVVYGHGVFTLGRSGFAEAFEAMVAVENWCRDEYFRLLAQRYPEPPAAG
jgi:ribulose-5-phosphate 4-epimerase/fuculose-1-phosphate aldolase